MRRVCRHSGFTLIELVLVLMVLAICAAIAAPQLAGFARGRALPNTAADLVTTCRWCRVQALSEGVEYRLNFDQQAGAWWVTKDNEDGTFVSSTKGMGRQYQVPDGVVIAGIQFTTAPDAKTADGTFISFMPGGKTEVAKVILTSNDVTAVIACDTPLGSYHIVGGPSQ